MFKKIYIEISNSCNFNCSFCCQSKREKRFLSTEEFRIITEKIKPFTNHIYLHVLGEPLLHPHLNTFLEIAKNQRLQVNITTNGSLLLKQEEVLQNADIRQINISLHDWQENIDDIAQKLPRVIAVAKRLSKKCYICFRLWNWNMGSCSEFNKLCVNILKEELNLEENFLPKKTSGNGITLVPNIFLQTEERFIWPNINSEQKYKEKNCYALRDHIAILSDGTVVPCCLDAEGNLALGNIFENSLEDILQTPRAEKIREGFKQHKAEEIFCKTCGFMTHGK